MENVYINEIKPELEEDRGIQDVRISFQKALAFSVLRDENLNLIRFSWKRDKLDLKQARSMIFPRIQLQLFNEVYYSNSEKRIKDNIDGGLLFQYNFLNVFFQSGHVSMKKAVLQSSFMKGRIEIQNIFFRLLSLLLKVDYDLREIELSKKLLEYSLDGLRISEKMAGNGQVKPRAIWTWSNYVRDAREQYERVTNQLGLHRRALKYMLGKTKSGNIEIPDAEDYFPEFESFSDQKMSIPDAINDAWNQRYDVKLAEINLYLSELNVAKAKMSWLNYFRFSLGLGRFFVYRDDDWANITLNTSIAFPIFDIGDSKRIKKKAKINRDIARSRVSNLAKSISREVREAVERIHMLRNRKSDSEKMVNLLDKQNEMVKRMIQLNQADSLDLYLVRTACLNARIRYNRCCFDLKNALLHLKNVCGTLLSPEIEEKLFKKIADEK